jgi:hypothetical protein
MNGGLVPEINTRAREHFLDAEPSAPLPVPRTGRSRCQPTKGTRHQKLTRRVLPGYQIPKGRRLRRERTSRHLRRVRGRARATRSPNGDAGDRLKFSTGSKPGNRVYFARGICFIPKSHLPARRRNGFHALEHFGGAPMLSVSGPISRKKFRSRPKFCDAVAGGLA